MGARVGCPHQYAYALRRTTTGDWTEEYTFVLIHAGGSVVRPSFDLADGHNLTRTHTFESGPRVRVLNLTYTHQA